MPIWSANIPCSDQGSNLNNEVISLCKQLGIDQTKTTAYHPQTNGQVKRFNRTLVSEVVSKNQRDWDSYLPKKECCLHIKPPFMSPLDLYLFLLIMGTLQLCQLMLCWEEYQCLWSEVKVFLSMRSKLGSLLNKHTINSIAALRKCIKPTKQDMTKQKFNGRRFSVATCTSN